MAVVLGGYVSRRDHVNVDTKGGQRRRVAQREFSPPGLGVERMRHYRRSRRIGNRVMHDVSALFDGRFFHGLSQGLQKLMKPSLMGSA